MVSVCMATYNGEKYIKAQIESILKQLGKNDELIISDDGSKDGTLSIIKAFNDVRIKLLFNKSKHGFVGNFENALRNARGEIIFLSDQDDVWYKDKIKKICLYLQDYDMIVHNANIVDGNGIYKGYTYFSLTHHGTGFMSNLWKTRFLGCCMAFSRNVLDYCLPIPQNIVAHDYWLGMFSMTHFKVGFIPEVLMAYRRHGGNVSPSTEKSNNNIVYKLFTKRFILLYEIAKRIVKW